MVIGEGVVVRNAYKENLPGGAEGVKRLPYKDRGAMTIAWETINNSTGGFGGEGAEKLPY